MTSSLTKKEKRHRQNSRFTCIIRQQGSSIFVELYVVKHSQEQAGQLAAQAGNDILSWRKDTNTHILFQLDSHYLYHILNPYCKWQLIKKNILLPVFKHYLSITLDCPAY